MAYMNSRVLITFLAICELAFLVGCASDIARQPVYFEANKNSSFSEKRIIREDTSVTFTTGYKRIIRKGSTWVSVGGLPQGTVYAPSDSVFTVEGSNIHEAYLVVVKGNLIGYYLPVEKSFVQTSKDGIKNLWGE